MKASFIFATSACALVILCVYLAILLSCGMGPDSPAACNDPANIDAHRFLVGAAIAYLAVGLVLWFVRKRTAK